ncbi:hypothetical protein [Moorena bouillonii]|uniref:hypothetical protein n=1 Tax=Moorena bouillonii TaxID=207920 RepID=UPI00117D4FC4|nr:hypothetical protein [Moorena bouillonii]NEO51488.1 hypothetical protein [Moorena sp. SIO4A3]
MGLKPRPSRTALCYNIRRRNDPKRKGETPSSGTTWLNGSYSKWGLGLRLQFQPNATQESFWKANQSTSKKSRLNDICVGESRGNWHRQVDYQPHVGSCYEQCPKRVPPLNNPRAFRPGSVKLI